MIKRIKYFALALFIIFATSSEAYAFDFSLFGIKVHYENIFSDATALDNLNKSVFKMAENINDATSTMMKIGDLVICNSLHGAAAAVSFKIPGIGIEISFNDLKLVAPLLWISGQLLYIIGFFITVIANFYLFDIAFNLSIAIVLLPIALALWPFKWTAEHLKTVINSVVYYTGIFMFLPLGIVIAEKLIRTVIGETLGEGDTLIVAFNEDNSDLIKQTFSLFTMSFLKILITYIVAIRILPLLAKDFCQHYFGQALAGNPMSEKLSQGLSILKKKTVDKVGKYMKDVAKHQTGKGIVSLAQRGDGFFSRALEQYGRNLSKTKR